MRIFLDREERLFDENGKIIFHFDQSSNAYSDLTIIPEFKKIPARGSSLNDSYEPAVAVVDVPDNFKGYVGLQWGDTYQEIQLDGSDKRGLTFLRVPEEEEERITEKSFIPYSLKEKFK